MRNGLLILMAAGLAGLGVTGRRGNGDMVNYIAEVLYLGRPTPRMEEFPVIHAQIWQACRDVLTEAQYRELAEGTRGRQVRSHPQTGPTVLWNDYYQRHFANRVLYNYANRALWQCGVPLGMAPYVTSAVCAGLCVIPVYVLIGGGWWGIAGTLLCCVAWRAELILANTATPDAMAALLALSAVAWRRHWWSMGFLVLAPVARPDMVLFSVTMAWFIRVPVPVRIITCLWSAGVYLAVQRVCPSPTWTEWLWTAMMPTLGVRLPEDLQELPAVDWTAYGRFLWHRLPVLWYDGSFRVALALASAAILLRRRDKLLLLGLPAAYVAGHFILYPVAFERFFLWCYLLVSCAVLRPSVGNRPPVPGPRPKPLESTVDRLADRIQWRSINRSIAIASRRKAQEGEF